MTAITNAYRVSLFFIFIVGVTIASCCCCYWYYRKYGCYNRSPFRTPVVVQTVGTVAMASPHNQGTASAPEVEKIKMESFNKPSGDSVGSTNHTDDPPVSTYRNMQSPASCSETSV